MPALELHCTVAYNRMITPTVFELGFTTDKAIEFKAGQFISVVIPGAGPKGRDLRRAYSIASAPQARPIELCVRLVDGGPGTNFLYQLKEGATFRGFAPYGDFVYEPKEGAHAVFIATGTGMAPFRSMILSPEYQAALPVSATCLLGVRTDDELLYLELAKHPGVKWVSCVTQPSESWKGFRGRVTDHLRSLGDTFPWHNSEYYLCGNGAMINEVKALLTEMGVSKDSVHQEKYY